MAGRYVVSKADDGSAAGITSSVSSIARFSLLQSRSSCQADVERDEGKVCADPFLEKPKMEDRMTCSASEYEEMRRQNYEISRRELDDQHD